MTMLEQIALKESANPSVINAIESLDHLGNPTQKPNRPNDCNALSCVGSLISGERVVIASDNAILMLLFQLLPNTCQQVVIQRADLAAASLTAFASLEGKLTSKTDNTDGRSTSLVIDAVDMDRHKAQIEAELRSGHISQVWIHSTNISFVRNWMASAGENLFEHMPYSRGFSGANLTAQQCVRLADSLDACAKESRWIPSSLNAKARQASKLNVIALKWLAQTIGESREKHESLLCGLSKRVGGLMDQIWADMNTALPHVSLEPAPRKVEWTNQWKKDLIAANTAIEGFLLNHPREDLLIAMMSDQRLQVLDRVKRISESATKKNPKEMLMEAAHLACDMFHLREQMWWMRDWHTDDNLTWEILVNKQCTPGSLGPKPVKPLKEYLDLYWFEGARNATQIQSSHAQTDEEANCQLDHRLDLLGSLNHSTRRAQAAELCSLMLHRLGAQYPNETIRWLDVGCGNGRIANAARIPEWLEDRVEIIGLDFGEGMVQQANRSAAKHRRYIVANALTPPEELMSMRFHMVSAFEFLEHLIDPVALLTEYAKLKPEIMIAGSPLNEKQPTAPARAHTWSFRREGYEAVFEAAGMQIQYSSEVRIGSYNKGHDWLTVVGAFGEGIKRDISGKARKIATMKSMSPV